MTRKFLTIAAGASLAALVACAPGAGTIDRVQPNALDKSQFEGIWYYRAAVIDSDPESGATEGITSNMDKIRWEITEDLLIGYRSYEFIPYAEGLTDEGRDFFGTPVVAYEILSHFDIQREYNAVTGVENNVISENEEDRPWFERRYMRVDWSQNIVGTPTMFWTGWSAYPDAYFSGTALAKYYVQGHEENDPNRPFFTENYFDITNVYSVEPAATYCLYTLLYNGVPRCGAGNVKVRLAFRKVDPTADYEPLYYPDVVELTDDAGNAIVLNFDGRTCGNNYDPSDCAVKTYDYDAAFGNFRILRVAFDRERFLTRTGRIYLAGRFNLWEDTYNDNDGSLIPYVDRKPKAVVYYGNPRFPEELIPAAQKLAAGWNKPFAETVAFRKDICKDENGAPATCADFNSVPDLDELYRQMGEDMFQFRQNDCNRANIISYAEEKGYTDVINRVAGSVENVGRGNIENICAAVQFAELQDGKVLDPAVAEREGKELAFTWQRKGDLRYNFQNYIEQLQPFGPWGVAQFGQDPETGEFLSNTANYFGDAGDSISQREVDVVQWLNGDLDEEELFRGDLTRKTVVSNRAAKNTSIRDAVRGALMSHEADLLAESGDGLFPPTDPGAEEERLKSMFGGTSIEREFLVDDEILRGFAGPELYQPYALGTSLPSASQQQREGLPSLEPGVASEEAIAKASPVNWGLGANSNAYLKMVEDLGSRAFDLADFFDPNSAGLAAAMKGKSREEIFDFMRFELYAAVNGHEVGHTVGLRHNFEGSMDALNYKPEFWWKQDPVACNDQLPCQGGTCSAEGVCVDDQGQVILGEIKQFWNNQATPDNPNSGGEYKYASIMDYGFDIPLEGLHGIGAYDEAAVRFMYGQLVSAWNPNKVSIPDPRKYGSWARRCGHDDEFLGLPALLWWLGPETIPSVLSAKPKDQTACAGNYDNTNDDNGNGLPDGLECDSNMDSLFRELSTRMEATSERLNLPSQCGIWYNISDLNWLFGEVKARAPDPQAIYGGRMLVTVDDMIDQMKAVLRNPPEYDDPSTDVNEAADGLDSDGDDQPDDKGFNWADYIYEVDYGYCSDQFAGYSNPRCQRWDTGWDFEQSTAMHINKYDRDYIFDGFRRDRINFGNTYSYMLRLISRRFVHMTNVFRYYLYTRRTAFEAPLFQDWAEAAYRGVNFLERVLQTPEPGTYCLDAGNNHYTMWDGVSDCPEQFELGLGYGAGRYLNNSWTNEYFYKPNRIGSFYDKVAAIFQMTTSSGFFVRDVADLFDRRAFALGYLRVYEDPMLQRFSAMISGDFTGYRSRVVVDDDTGEKYVRYMPFFDEELEDGASVRQWLDPEPSIDPAWSWSLQYISLFYTLGNWGSLNDSAPEFYRFTKIAIKDTVEDVEYPADWEIQEFSDPETFITYRAPCIEPVQTGGLVGREFPAYYGDWFHKNNLGKYHQWGVGCAILQQANTVLTEQWQPAQVACEDAGSEPSSEECQDFARARKKLNELVGYIDVLRKFGRRAEGW